MWHVDEGGLHAYLDDALDALPGREGEFIREHLATCDACRRRLAEERAVRAEARSILALASPDLVDVPTFGELEERAGTHVSGGAGSRGRWQWLGWAASVVAAGVVGWMLGGRSVSSGDIAGSREVVGPEVRVVGPSTSQGETIPHLQRAPEAQAQQDEAAPTKRDKPGPASPRAAVAAIESVGRPAVDTTVTVAARAHSSDEASVRRVEASRAASLPALRSEPLFPPVPLGVMGRRFASSTDFLAPVVASRPEPVEFGALVPSDKARSAGAGSAALARSRLLPTSGGADPASDAVVRQATLPTFAFTAPGGGKAIAGVDREPEAPASLIVSGLQVVDVSWLEPEGAGGGVRVLQLLDSGDTLELIQLPAGSSRPQVGDLPPDGRTQIVQVRNGGWLIARARLPRSALKTLVDRLGGG
jgi:hypothetical protein